MAAGFDEGFYSVGTCAVDADMVFKVLDAEVSSSAMQNVEVNESRQNVRAATRADDDFDVSEDDIDISFSDESEDLLKGKFTIPIKAKIPLTKIKLKNKKARKKEVNKGMVISENGTITNWQKSGDGENGEILADKNLEGNIEFKKEETKMEHDFTLNIKREGVFTYVDFKDNVKTEGTAHIMGGITWSKSFEVVKSIKTPLKIGPIGFRLIVGGGASIDASLFGSINVDFSNKSVIHIKHPLTTSAAGLAFFKAYQTVQDWNSDNKDNESFKLEDGMIKVRGGNYEGGLSISPHLKLGVGIGTKKVSLCFVGSFTAEANATSPGTTSYLAKYDISDKPELSIKSNFELALQIGLTLNVYEIIKGIQEDAIDLGSLGVKGYKMLVKVLKDKDIVNDDFPDEATSIEDFLKACEQVLNNQDAKVTEALNGIPLDLPIPKIPLGEWNILPETEALAGPWFPQIKNFSYKRTSTTSEGATYYVSWAYANKGVFPNWGMSLYPCLYVDGGKNDPATGTYYPELGGYDETDPINKNTNIKHYGTGISVPKLQAGKSYTVYPALSFGRDKEALLLDVAQVLTPAYPSVKIVSTDQESCYQTDVMKQSGYYGYIMEAKVAVKGAARIYEWEVEFHLAKRDGSDLAYIKRVKGNYIKETSGHPVRMDLTYHKPEFETMMYGEYHVIESQPGEELHTTPMEIVGYPLIGAWSEWNFSRRKSNQLSAPLAPMPSENIDKIDEMLEDPDFDKDVPIVFIDGELVTPVAITKNGIRKPIPPLR